MPVRSLARAAPRRRLSPAAFASCSCLLSAITGLLCVKLTWSSAMDLIADIGATNARIALVDDKGQEVATEVFHNADFTGVPGLLGVYLDHRRASDRPRRAAIAIAAPITGDEVRMTNIDWSFSQL